MALSLRSPKSPRTLKLSHPKSPFDLQRCHSPTRSPLQQSYPISPARKSHTSKLSFSGLSHPCINSDGWFEEKSRQFPGQSMSLQVKKILHIEQSKFQDVLVFESTNHGTVLVLDGIIQCVENDEFSYQEMIAHLPLASHPNPKKVLVIGGGDGGVLREILKHPSVQEAVLCDIDEAVPRVSKEFLPRMAKGFADPRVTVFIGDGFEFLRKRPGAFDVIITDSSDPAADEDTPANTLFQRPYFELLKASLAPGGTICNQGETIWLDLDIIKSLVSMNRSIFPNVQYAQCSVPTYTSGTIGFILCSLDASRDLKTPLRDVEPCRYWSPEVHRAAFTLPRFAQLVVNGAGPDEKEMGVGFRSA